MFEISDISFFVIQSYLDAYVDEVENELVWGLQIKGKSKNEAFDHWEPHIDSEILLRTKPGETKTWYDIADKIIEWEDYPENEEEPHAFLYIYEHEPIYHSKINFENRNNEMVVKWDALCDVGWDEKYSGKLPLKIETKVSFAGILFGKGKSEEVCKKIIAPFLKPDDFKFVVNKYGVSILVPTNEDLSTNCLVLGDY